MWLGGAGVGGLLAEACLLGVDRCWTRSMASCAEGARAGSYGPCLPSFSALQKRYKNQPWHPWAPPVPSAASLVITGMSATTTSPGLSALSVGGTTALSQRLSEQLEALSQVGESLTLRLLELEERLGGLEQKLGAQSQPGGSARSRHRCSAGGHRGAHRPSGGAPQRAAPDHRHRAPAALPP